MAWDSIVYINIFFLGGGIFLNTCSDNDPLWVMALKQMFFFYIEIP